MMPPIVCRRCGIRMQVQLSLSLQYIILKYYIIEYYTVMNNLNQLECIIKTNSIIFNCGYMKQMIFVIK